METKTEKTKPIPLVVDLDGTFLKTELPWEAFLSALKRHPLQLIKIIFKKIQVRTPAYFKTETKKLAHISLETLPFSKKFGDWLKEERAQGRTLILCTGSIQSYADEVQKHTQLFDIVYGSTLGTNLAGSKKALFLTGRLGKHQFDYAGNAVVDLTVARYARKFILVNPSFLASLFSKKTPIHRCFREKEIDPSHLSTTLGFPLWFLNCLIFIFPPLFAGSNVSALFPVLFLAGAHFNFSATACNILFDLFLIDRDRKNLSKQSDNLFATGDLSIPFGLFLFTVFFMLAFLSLCYLGLFAVGPSLLYAVCIWLLVHGKIKQWFVPIPIRYILCALTVLLQGFLIVN